MRLVYKIMGASDWATARRTGSVPAADIDRRDGYIHLSAEDQVLETARLHFAGREDLVAAAFDADALGPALKWEASRGGASFPHLYAALRTAEAVSVRRLAPVDGGEFAFGEAVE
ncbi:MAG: hypothetical protein A3E78_05840 [Alphaproteobacteria bacterium RIFCSPHIGHO2_12_FULL_63_12]|nr:MAG: hypothetical protein A3E78_05840 [Alphaproteobacteria bacterium RIFCSPHIGHO2_12_FULL_63_12]